MKRRVFALVLTVIMALSLAAPALAYTTPDFSDVPSNHWAYEAVMKMADAGVIKGTGNGQFSPDMKLSAEMFVVLVGRVVFPDVKAEGADWSGPYITEAKAKGLLTGTNVTDANIKGDISRYDMAVILAKCVELLKVSATKADSSKVADYGDIPNRYTDAVLMAYGSGLIRGDQSGSFNGQNSMTRQEAATVMSRLIALKPGGSTTTEPDITPDPTGTEPVKPTEPPSEVKMASYSITGNIRKTDHAIGRPVDDKHTYLPNVPFKVYYTDDGGVTSTLVAEGVTGNREWDGGVPEGEGKGEFALTFELPEDAFSWPNQDQKGVFFSAETRLDGQRLVSSDLRTDGREYIDLWHLVPDSNEFGNYRNVELTPPDGEKAKFTYKGHVLAFVEQGHWYEPLPGFAVQLHLADGRMLGEAVSGADGAFSMDCEVDALDGGLKVTSEIYYVTASGYINGKPYEYNGKYEDVFELKSLYSLGIYYDNGSLRPNPDNKVKIYEWHSQK